MSRWVISLESPDAGNLALAGGKGARLHRLLQAGLSVPRALVVTTEAFHAHLPHADPTTPPESPPLQGRLRKEIEAAVHQHFPDPNDYLAVRSSAIAEDSAGASFAGQHATYYYIDHDSVADAVRKCWLSLWSAQARAYRSARPATSPDDFAMAVLVQRMVQADSSGVCFTRDPVDAAPDTACIEATWGLGAALVDGRVSPDRLTLSRTGQILRRHIGHKRQRIATALKDPEGTRLEPVPAHLQGVDALTDDQARAVLELSLAAESLFDEPQDVEWAFENGRLHVLQSRPITAAVEPLRSAAPPGQWILFKPIAENFLEPLTPMSADLFGQVLPPPIGRFIDGRYYLNFLHLAKLLPFKWSNRQLADVILLRGPPPALPVDWRKVPLAAAAGALAYLTDGISWHRSARLEPKSLEAFAELCQRIEAAPAMDAREALFRLFLGRGPFEPIGRQALQVNLSAGRYFLYLGALRGFLARYGQGFDASQINHLCSGEPDMQSRQMVEAVQRLAREAARDTDLAAALKEQAPEGYARLLAALPENHPFCRCLEDFLKTYGHRCVREIELATPRWREEPVTVLHMVRNYLQDDLQLPADRHSLHLLARDALRQALPRRWQQRVALYLADRIRYYVTLRENTRHYHTMAFATVRSKLKTLEQRLLEDGRLRVQDDIFFLTWKEAVALARGELDWPDIAAQVRRRRRRHQRLARERPPETLNVPDLQPETIAKTAGHDGERWLHGYCASPGTAEGPVRIITDPTTAAHLNPGDILVAPYTDPAWTPLFPIAGAVVVEVGSYLSHAGTVAREYQIPCLVEVSDCVGRLRDGQRVRVLATQGRLEIVQP